jgi:hypothetical protein
VAGSLGLLLTLLVSKNFGLPPLLDGNFFWCFSSAWVSVDWHVGLRFSSRIVNPGMRVNPVGNSGFVALQSLLERIVYTFV